LKDVDSQGLRRYVGTGLLIGFLTGTVEAAIVNRTGLVFVPFAALAYGIVFSLGFLLLALGGRALRRNLLPIGIAGALAFSIILEAAFWLNKRSPLPAGSTQSKILNLGILLVGIALGTLAARFLWRRLAAAAYLKRMLWVLACLIVLLGVYFTFVYFQSSPGTNCILISIDALRPDHLGCYGYHRDTSPNIDRLAAGGTMWQRAFSTCPGSTAGHASMLTGLFTLSHGAYSNGVRLPDEAVTAAEVFKQNGYSTAAFTRNWFISPAIGFGQGFDCFVDNGYGLILKIATPRTLMLGLALWQTALRIIRWPGRPSTLEIDTALDWMRSRRRHRFFMFLHIMDAHSPYIPPGWAAGGFGEGNLDRAHIQGLHDESLSRRLTAEESAFLIDRYDEEILAADLKIGMITDELERLGIMDNTMIILLADHGELMDEAESKQFGHGTLDYGGLRIPMIMHFPGVIPVRVYERETVQCVDILPTVTGLLHLDDPASRQGISLFADGGSLNYGDSLYAERPAFASANILERDEYSVITPHWQYTLIGDGASLHSLEDNPYDAPDVMASYPAIAESLELVLFGWIEKCLAEAVIPFSAEGRSAKPGPDARKKLKALGYVQ
jgi:arylsulfatase A-like enzyme